LVQGAAYNSREDYHGAQGKGKVREVNTGFS
jgi:hypothetical protein